MGDRHDSAGGLSDAAEAWFLRTGEDTVYGELTLHSLSEWAESGRILPHHEVSRNGEDWVKAESVPELKMDWYVHLKSGAPQGPLNLLALPDLLRRGQVDPSAVLRNKLTNREISAASILRGVKDPTKGPKPPAPVRKARVRAAPSADGQSQRPGQTSEIAPKDMPQRTALRASGAPPSLIRPAAATGPEAEAVVTPAFAPPSSEAATAPVAATGAAQRETAAADKGALEEDLARARKELGEHKDRIGELLKQLADETALHEQLRARHTRESRQHEEQLAAKVKSIQERDKGLVELQSRCMDLEKAKRPSDQAAARPDLQPRVAELEKEVGALREANTRVKQEHAALGAEKDRLTAELERAKQAQARLERSLADLQTETRSLAGEKRELTDATRHHTTDAGRLEQEKGALEKQNLDLRQQHGLLERKQAECARALEALGKALEAPSPVEKEWFLRLDDKQVYGPVDLRELYGWAADCRIGPGQQVSRDKTRWQPVEDVAELRMDWKIKLVDGKTYGPLNAFAVPQLVRDGVSAIESPLTHRKTGKEEHLEEVLIGEAGMLLKQESEYRQQTRQRDRRLAELRTQVKTIKKQLAARPQPAPPPEQTRAAIAPPNSLKSMLRKRPGSSS